MKLQFFNSSRQRYQKPDINTAQHETLFAPEMIRGIESTGEVVNDVKGGDEEQRGGDSRLAHVCRAIKPNH